MPGPVLFDELVLGYPVDLPRDGIQVPRLHRVEHTLPHAEYALADRVRAVPVREIAGLGQVLALDAERAHLTAVCQPHRAPPGHVKADLTDGPGRVVQDQVRHHGARLDHAQHQDAEFERLLAAEAKLLDIGQPAEASWHVLADPEGNEFCLLKRRLAPL